MIRTSYRRWLGFLAEYHPADLLKPPVDRITPERVRAFVDHLSAEAQPTTVAMAIAHLYAVVQLIGLGGDWCWLSSLKSRLASRAIAEDRFDRLVPPWCTLDLGIEMMEQAANVPAAGKQRERYYRDGLLIAFISAWPIRRRSIAALTVSRHLEFDAAGLNILLFPEDTKSKRAESFRVPDELLPYLLRYLKEIRPGMLGRAAHDGLWPSIKGCPLTSGRIYDIVRARIKAKFGKDMGLHDFRRSAATFIATDAPAKTGLVPGVLQHVSPEVSEQHYNLAQSVEASRRFAAHLSKLRSRLRPIPPRHQD
jgi:integrase